MQENDFTIKDILKINNVIIKKKYKINIYNINANRINKKESKIILLNL